MSSPYAKTTWVTGDVVTQAKANNWETQYDCVLDSGDKAPAGNWFWNTAKKFGWSDGYWERVSANVAKFWNGTTLGTVTAGTVNDSVGSMATLRAAIAAIQSAYPTCNGRLTLESGVPVSTTDQATKGTLYFTPFRGNQIGLYDGASAWAVLAFSELSISLSGLTASKPYDVFVYNNSGTATLELLVWTNTTTRATALTLQDGIYVKSGATTRRYVGTILINASGNDCDDTLANPGVWNLYNQADRPVAFIGSGTASWVTPGGAYRSTGNNSANSINILVGLAGVSAMNLQASNLASLDDGNGYMGSGIGIDSSTTNSAQVTESGQGATTIAASIVTYATYNGYPALGKRQYRWLEYGVSNSGTGTASIQMGPSNGRNMGLTGRMAR